VNTLGTAHLLEALRGQPELRAVLVVTTDKVYENAESGGAFRESDPLGGHDPYSASKAAVEIVTRSFARSFFADVPVVTARGGNVIGGGDFAEDRLVPDVWRAAGAGKPVVLRYPNATRPWQHVLDCLNGYLLFLEDAETGKTVPHALNFGPDENSTELRVHDVVERLQSHLGNTAGWIQEEGAVPKEMQALTLSPALSKSALGWRARLDTESAIAWTADWYGALGRSAGMAAVTASQIEAFTEIA
jgi:CDP-glucose 4,6-dehydratase